MFLHMFLMQAKMNVIKHKEQEFGLSRPSSANSPHAYYGTLHWVYFASQQNPVFLKLELNS